jgi:hypothetical protein
MYQNFFNRKKKLDLQGGKTATGHCIKKKIFSRRSRLKKILEPLPHPYTAAP